MAKSRWLLSAFLIFVSCAYIPTARLSTEEVFRTTAKSAVLVVVSQGFGSGTVIFAGPGGNLILTCAHVTAGSEHDPIEIVDSTGTRHMAVLYSSDAKLDLALLYTVNTNLPALSVAEKTPAIYDTMFIVASPAGFHNSASMGWLSNKRSHVTFRPGDPRNGAKVWIVTAGFVGPGASGGTIVDGEAHLVCVPEAAAVKAYPTITEIDRGITFIPLPQLIFCIPLPDIKQFLKDNNL